MNYINAHATSTLVGDIAEVKAVRSVFSDWSSIKMNGTKSMVGHCLGAAAGVEAIATIQAIRKGEVHPTINHKVRGLVSEDMHAAAGRQAHATSCCWAHCQRVCMVTQRAAVMRCHAYLSACLTDVTFAAHCLPRFQILPMQHHKQRKLNT